MIGQAYLRYVKSQANLPWQKKKENRLADYHTVFVPGKVYWPKIVGNRALHDNYDGDAREWSYELVPDDTDFLKTYRLLDRLKDNADEKNPDKGEFLRLKKPEFDKDGNKNEAIKIVNNDPKVTDEDGEQLEDWDNRLLGNGTRVVAKLTIAEWGKGKKSSIWTTALRVDDHVPHEGGGGNATDFSGFDGKKAGKGAAKAKPPKADAKGKAQPLDELDDDVPF